MSANIIEIWQSTTTLY